MKKVCNYLLREPSYSQFCPKIRCHSIWDRQGPSDSAGPKIGNRCKQGAIIFHGGRVVVNFCPKIRCHGNMGRQGKILTTSSSSLDPIIEGRCKQRAIIFYGDRVIPL